MKGILKYHEPKHTWYIEYQEDDRIIRLDVKRNRIEDLNSVGTYLKVLDVVDFVIENTFEFPYQWAVPIINMNGEAPIPTAAPQVRYKKQFKLQLWLSEFPESYHEIICDGYDTNSAGYWYFYNNNENGGRKYLGAFPIDRTAIYEIEEIQTEY